MSRAAENMKAEFEAANPEVTLHVNEGDATKKPDATAAEAAETAAVAAMPLQTVIVKSSDGKVHTLNYNEAEQTIELSLPKWVLQIVDWPSSEFYAANRRNF